MPSKRSQGQNRGAKVSGERRTQRAAEAKAREARRAEQLTPGHHPSCGCESCCLQRQKEEHLSSEMDRQIAGQRAKESAPI
jgi:hypothetical protein